MIYDSVVFIHVCLTNEASANWDGFPGWLKVWLLISPPTVLLIYIMSAIQTYQHVERIREESAVQRHDRAVQIV